MFLCKYSLTTSQEVVELQKKCDVSEMVRRFWVQMQPKVFACSVWVLWHHGLWQLDLHTVQPLLFGFFPNSFWLAAPRKGLNIRWTSLLQSQLELLAQVWLFPCPAGPLGSALVSDVNFIIRKWAELICGDFGLHRPIYTDPRRWLQRSIAGMSSRPWCLQLPAPLSAAEYNWGLRDIPSLWHHADSRVGKPHSDGWAFGSQASFLHTLTSLLEIINMLITIDPKSFSFLVLLFYIHSHSSFFPSVTFIFIGCDIFFVPFSKYQSWDASFFFLNSKFLFFLCLFESSVIEHIS